MLLLHVSASQMSPLHEWVMQIGSDCAWRAVTLLLTGVLVVVNVVQVAGLLAKDHTVQTLVHEAVVVLDELPY